MRTARCGRPGARGDRDLNFLRQSPRRPALAKLSPYMPQNPPYLDALLNTAIQHHQAGRLAQAEALYRQILQHNPHDPDALHLLGALAALAQQPEMALALFRQSLAVQPASAVAWSNMGKL